MLETNQQNNSGQLYSNHYNGIVGQIANSPNSRRECINCGCALFFVLLVLVFFGTGVLEIVRFQLIDVNQVDGPNDLADNRLPILEEKIQIVVEGIGMSILISLFYILTVKLLPRFMIFILAFTSSSLIISLLIYGIVTDNQALYIVMIVILVLNLMSLCFVWKKLDMIVSMIRACSIFLKQKPSVFFTALFSLLLTVGITAFYIFSTIAIQGIIEHEKQDDDSLQNSLLSVQLAIYIIFIGVMYYIICFAIGVQCGSWYYRTKGGIGVWGCWVLKSIGGIMRAIFMVVATGIIDVFMMMRCNQCPPLCPQENQKNNGANRNPRDAPCCSMQCLCNCLIDCCKACFQACLLACVEGCKNCTSLLCLQLKVLTFQTRDISSLTKVFNHYTVLIISLTGEQYINAARTSMGLMEKQLNLMIDINFLCSLLNMWGLVITVGGPLIFGYFITGSMEAEQKIIILGAIAACSLLISIVVLSIVVESISCIFILFLLDRDLAAAKLIECQRLDQETYLIINRMSKNPYANGSQIITVQSVEGAEYAKLNE